MRTYDGRLNRFRHNATGRSFGFIGRLASAALVATLLAAHPLAGQATSDTTASPGTDTTTSAARVDSPRATPRQGSSATDESVAARARAVEDSLAAAETARNAKDGGWGRFPRPIGWAVFAIIVLGALGALAGDLVADGTRLDRWGRDDSGWTLGFPGRLLIGVVTALIVVLGIRPPNGSWPVLLSSALAVGAASEALLLAIMASWKARIAENETRRVRNAAVEKIESVRVGIRAIQEAAARGAGGAGGALERAGGSATAGLGAQVDRLAERAKAEFLAETEHPADSSIPLVSHSIRKAPMRDSFETTGFDVGGGTSVLAAKGKKTQVIAHLVAGEDIETALITSDDEPDGVDFEGSARDQKATVSTDDNGMLTWGISLETTFPGAAWTLTLTKKGNEEGDSDFSGVTNENGKDAQGDVKFF
jgi:hypothetical protein